MSQRSKPVVLLVEDNRGDALLVEEALRSLALQWTLVCVDNAVQAYRYLQRRAPFATVVVPDLIILDLSLPVIHGQEFLAEVKRSPQWRDIPILVFTSSRRDTELRDAISAGAFRCLSKPPYWSGYVHAVREIDAQWRAHVGAA